MSIKLPDGYERYPETPEIHDENGVTINLPHIQVPKIKETINTINEYFDYVFIQLNELDKRIKQLENKH